MEADGIKARNCRGEATVADVFGDFGPSTWWSSPWWYVAGQSADVSGEIGR